MSLKNEYCAHVRVYARISLLLLIINIFLKLEMSTQLISRQMLRCESLKQIYQAPIRYLFYGKVILRYLLPLNK